jgi:hypothetical protein
MESNFSKKRDSIIQKDIVIIGAGCAGLECAEKLYMHGKEKKRERNNNFIKINKIKKRNVFNYNLKRL